MNSKQLPAITEDYILKKLIYINSTKYGYGEFNLDENIALYGGNNAGKTAALSGMKILLFPETSFTNCEKKFMFIDKNGKYHRTDDSYAHYFPESRSFIVLEIQNPHGTFSMICYRTNNNGYARFFVPVEFNKIKDVFVTSNGEINPELSLKLVFETSKNLKGIKVSEKKELADIMFGGRYKSYEYSRFTVLPLVDGEKETIRALRNIYQLAFDSGKSSTVNLPAILASLVEMKRGNKREKLDANLAALVESRNRLAEEGEWLQELENASSIFERVWKQMSETKKALDEYSKKYYTVESSIVKFKRESALKRENLNYEINQKKSATNEIKLALSVAHRENIQNNANLESNEKMLEDHKKRLNSSKIVIENYPNFSEKVALKELNYRLKNENEKLVLLKEENGGQKLLQTKITEKNQLKVKTDNIETTLNKSEHNLFENISDKHAINVLNTLNPLLSRAQGKLNDQEQDVVSDFALLFSSDHSKMLTFKDKVINPDLVVKTFDLSKQREQLEEELKNNIKKIDNLNFEINSLQKTIKHEDPNTLYETCEKLVVILKGDIDQINAIPTLLSQISETEEKIKDLKGQMDPLSKQASKLSKEYESMKASWGKLEAKLTDLNQVLDKIKMVERDLDSAKLIYPPEHYNKGDFIETPTTKDGEKVRDLAKDFGHLFDSLKQQYGTLVNNIKNHPDIDSNIILNNFNEFEKNIRTYSNTYEILTHEKQNHSNAIHSHNQTMNSQLNELKEAQATVNRTCSEINNEINTYAISNLSKVSLNIHFDPAFLEIMHSLEKHEIEEKSLLEESFYKTLSELFSKKYFDNKTGRIKLQDIIKSVTYSYRKRDTDETEQKGQSGGTIATTTAFVLSVLLSKISAPYAKLKMPIIVDEMGTIDNKNQKAAIDQITKHGFSIFCAAPNYSANINQNIGKWVRIDRFYLENPMVSDCNIKCTPDFVETLVKIK